MKGAVIAGIVILVVGFVTFYLTFTSGVTALTPVLQSTLFLGGIAALPIGMAIASYGFAARVQAAGGGVSYKPARSGLVWAALAVGIIGIILGGVALAYVSSTSSSLSGQISGLRVVNVLPTTRTFRIDWVNTGNTGQDRYSVPVIVVNQGDTIFLAFEENDTDAHTFTMVGTAYSLQINDTVGPISMATGLPSPSTCSVRQNVSGCFYAHNFITNGNFTSGCSNTNTASNIGCVTGSSLLAAGTVPGTIAFNTHPAVSPPTVITFKNTNTVNGTMNSPGTPCTGPAGTPTPCHPAVFGVAAFTASTPGIFEYFCFFHVSNGMFGYLVVLPNAAAHAIGPLSLFPYYVPVEGF